MSFKDPWVLLLIPFVILIVFFLNKNKDYPTFRFSSNALFNNVAPDWKVAFDKNIIILRIVTITSILVALAGPHSVLEKTEIKTEGIDIVLALDASGSMAAEDFVINGHRQNRLSIVTTVVKDFIDKRPADRIGLVVFAARAYTACPLTTDHDWLQENLSRVELGVVKEDGTAVGSAIASSLSRLQDSKAKSKVIILLTDGMNNTGKIDPVSAAKAAAELGIKIYTIGAGSKGLVPYPAIDFFGRRVYQNVQIDLDETTLQEIAKITNGQYFRATDTESLKKIYQEIDKLEKMEIKQTGYKEYKQLMKWFLLAGLILLLLELILTNTILMRIP